MEVENETKEDNNIRSNSISLLKERKFELNNSCEQFINLVNSSKNLLFPKLSEKQKIKSKQYEYLNYINYKINEIANYDKKNRHLLENSSITLGSKKSAKNGKSNLLNSSIGSSDNVSTGLSPIKLGKEELLLNAENVVKSLDILNNAFEEYYAYHLWNVIYFNIILYRSFIYPSNNNQGVIEYCFVKNNDQESAQFIKENLLKAKTIQAIFIKKRKNSSCEKTINYIKDIFFKRYILRKDENNNILIKGVLKLPLTFFENYFLNPYEEFKNYEYIEISVFFNEILLYEDYDQDYDYTNMSKDEINSFISASKSLENIRNTLELNKKIVVS